MTAARIDAQTIEHPIAADGLVVIRLRSGDVRLRGTGLDRATVRTRDDRSLRDLDVETGAGSLSIGSERHSADLDVELPAGASVLVEAASADISANGLTGEQRYRTSSGDVTLSDVAGSITVEAVSGDLEISALGETSMALRTVSGDVGLAATTLRTLQVATTSGEIEVAGRFSADGPFRIETVSGDIRLEPVNDVQVEMETISGDLISRIGVQRDASSNRRILVIGQGGPTIGVRSTSGDVRVERERVTVPAAGPTPTPTPTPASDTADEEDLLILRALERGEIDTAEAGRRLADLETRATPDRATSDRSDA